MKENYLLAEGSLLLKASAVKISDASGSPTMMLIRQPDLNCEVSMAMEFEPANDGDEAGMTVYLSNRGYYSFSKQRREGRDYIVIAKNGNGFEPICKEVSAGKLALRIEASKDRYRFYCAVNDRESVCAGEVPVLARADAGRGFTGTLIGMFAQCGRREGADMRVCYFKSRVLG